MIEDTAQKAMQSVGKKIKEYARENVAIGTGPGPHPHQTPHKDTGNLMNAIGYRVQKMGAKNAKQWVVEVGVLNNEEVAKYGIALELGWTTTRNTTDKYGNVTGKETHLVQYPWLWDAINRHLDELQGIMKADFDTFFRGNKANGKKGYIYIGPAEEGASETPFATVDYGD